MAQLGCEVMHKSKDVRRWKEPEPTVKTLSETVIHWMMSNCFLENHGFYQEAGMISSRCCGMCPCEVIEASHPL